MIDPLQNINPGLGNTLPSTITTNDTGIHPLDTLGNFLLKTSEAFRGPQNTVTGYTGSSGIANSTPQSGNVPINIYNTPSTPTPTNVPTTGPATPTTTTPFPINNGVTTEQLANIYRDAGLTPEQLAGVKAGTGYSTIPAPGSVAGLYAPNAADAANQAEIDRLINATRESANQVVDPQKIYADLMARNQAQINAINTMYADRLNQARIQGQGRLESRQFAQGRAGQIGSGTGEAGVNAVVGANTDIENAIQNERNLAIQNVYAKVDAAATAEAAAKTLAKQTSADKLLQTLRDIPAQRKATQSSVISELVARGVKLQDMTPEEIKSYVDGLKTTEGELKGEFNKIASAAQSAADKAALEKATKEADIAKKNQDVLKSKFEISNWGKMTDYQRNQLAVEWYKANNPAGKTSDKKANALGQIASQIVPDQKLPDKVTPVLDNNGKITPPALDFMFAKGATIGLSKEEIIKQFDQFLYIDPKTGQPADTYGLSPSDKKIISGTLPTAGQ